MKANIIYAWLVFLTSLIPMDTVQAQSEAALHFDEFILQFAKVEEVYNDHVGNEWEYLVQVGDYKMAINDKVKIRLGKNEKIQVTCFLWETNEKHIDSAKHSIFKSFAELSKLRNDKFSIPVIITESNGRYAGNSAKMKFSIYIQ